ncbi:hypothetical protein CJP46_24610 [Paenibacillus sp. XY044]|nr:hypothetical protein CJP46_24610 [Paenibacillus sp. XY044]
MIKRVQAAGFTIRETKFILKEEDGNKLELSRAIEFLRKKMKEMDLRKREWEHTINHICSCLFRQTICVLVVGF